MGLITQDEYKAFASITGAKQDAQIDALISSCTSIVEQVLGYSYSASSIDTIILTANRYTYFIDSSHGTSTIIKYTPRSTGTEVTWAAGKDYILDNSGKIIILNTNIKDYDILNVESTQSSTVPEDIKMATMLLVKYYFKEDFNKTSVASGGQQVSYITGNNLPPHVRTLLLLHRVM